MASENVDWNDIALFLKVHEHGSFAKAAAALSVSQPTVTRRLQALERQLSINLVTRTPTGVALTPAGQELLEAARQMDRSASRFLESAVALDQVHKGPVGVSAPDGISAFWLVPRMKEFVDQYPDIELSIDCGLWPMESGRYVADVAFLAEEPKDLDLIRVPVCWLHYALFASESYLEENGYPSSLTDLIHHRTIFHATAGSKPGSLSEEVKAVGALTKHTLITNSSATSLNAVRAGVGVSALPTIVMNIAPELQPLPFGCVASVRAYLCYSKISSNTPRVQAVIEWISSVFEPKKTVWFQEEFIDPFEYRGAKTKLDNSVDLRVVE